MMDRRAPSDPLPTRHRSFETDIAGAFDAGLLLARASSTAACLTRTHLQRALVLYL
jgi:hypothetical protein